MTTWNRDNIQSLLDHNPKAVMRALLAIYQLQTDEEQITGATKDSNGVGFSAFDAEFCSSLAEKVKNGWTLSPKQMAIAKNKMKRYWRQLADIANAKEAMNARAMMPSVAPALSDKEIEDAIAAVEMGELVD